MQFSEGVICLKPSALADNTLGNLHNSSYDTQPLPIISNYTALSSRQLKQNRWISYLFIVVRLMSVVYFTITAESSRAHWLIFIVNKRTDT